MKKNVVSVQIMQLCLLTLSGKESVCTQIFQKVISRRMDKIVPWKLVAGPVPKRAKKQ